MTKYMQCLIRLAQGTEFRLTEPASTALDSVIYCSVRTINVNSRPFCQNVNDGRNKTHFDSPPDELAEGQWSLRNHATCWRTMTLSHQVGIDIPLLPPHFVKA